MAEIVLSAPPIGMGTFRYSGTPDGTTTIKDLIGGSANLGGDVSGFDLYVFSAPATTPTTGLFYANDGTVAAAATGYPLEVGPSMSVRDAKWPLQNDKFKFFATGAVVIAIALWG